MIDNSSPASLLHILINFVVCDVIMLIVVKLRLSWNPHLGLNVCQHVLGLLLHEGVASVKCSICNSSRNLHHGKVALSKQLASPCAHIMHYRIHCADACAYSIPEYQLYCKQALTTVTLAYASQTTSPRGIFTSQLLTQRYAGKPTVFCKLAHTGMMSPLLSQAVKQATSGCTDRLQGAEKQCCEGQYSP